MPLSLSFFFFKMGIVIEITVDVITKLVRSYQKHLPRHTVRTQFSLASVLIILPYSDVLFQEKDSNSAGSFLEIQNYLPETWVIVLLGETIVKEDQRSPSFTGPVRCHHGSQDGRTFRGQNTFPGCPDYPTVLSKDTSKHSASSCNANTAFAPKFKFLYSLKLVLSWV